MNIEEIKFKFKFRDEIDFPATITLILGVFEIRGFCIRKSKYPKGNIRHALYPPSRNVGGYKWMHIFFCSDKKIWAKIEDKALEEFYHQQDKYLLSETESDSKIKIDF